MRSRLEVNLCAVALSVRHGEPVCAVLDEGVPGFPAHLPQARLDIDGDRTLQIAMQGQLRTTLGLDDVGYLEQLYTFADRDRDPRTRHGWPRVVTIAYLALLRTTPALATGARWASIYDHLPWEDIRDGHQDTALARRAISRSMPQAEGLFTEGHDWDEYRVLERYESMYECGLVAESPVVREQFGLPLALDHRRILATALTRLRGKIRFRPVVFELLAEKFTLFQLQQVVEALAGVRLHKQNFRRLLERNGLVEATGETDRSTGGRPASIYRFRMQALTEHSNPGIGIPRVGP